jgi:anaerobic ribonucleoside-triphosphate reductase
MGNQFLVIGITGLNECVQILNDKPLVSSEGLKLGGQIIDYLQQFAHKTSEETKLSFVLTDHVSHPSAERFAKLDLKFHGEFAQPYIQELGGIKTYSVGMNLPLLEKQENLLQILTPIGELQRKIFNGTIIEIPKKLIPTTVTGMWEFCRQAIEKAQILGFRLI